VHEFPRGSERQRRRRQAAGRVQEHRPQPGDRQRAFAIERGWGDLDFVQTVGDDYARDLGLIDEKGNEYPGFTVYQKERERVRVFYNAEMPAEAADPGQDPRGAVDIAPLWNILDMTPEGRGTDWYPKLNY